MLTRKNSEQKNVRVDKDMYTEKEMEKLMNMGFVHWLDDKDLSQHDTMPNWWEYKETEFIVFLEYTKEIKVIYNKERGFYQNVVVMNNGAQIYINL